VGQIPVPSRPPRRSGQHFQKPGVRQPRVAARGANVRMTQERLQVSLLDAASDRIRSERVLAPLVDRDSVDPHVRAVRSRTRSWR
jgi:hypothetical protein